MALIPGIKPKWSIEDVTTENPEHTLYESVITEFVDIAGFSVDYMQKIHHNTDYLYGESTIESLSPPKRTKIIYQPQTESMIPSIFGIMSDEVVSDVQMPKLTFYRDVSQTSEPVVGDVIRILFSNKLYEIADIQYQQRIFQGKILTYSFVLRPYRHNESIDNTIISGDLNSLNEFPEVNISLPELPNLLDGSDNQKANSEQKNIDDYDDVDTSFYGFDKM